MEDPILKSPELTDNAKYVSGVSTILVATIQEAKDRISQIEYIFCSQLYPNIQAKSNIMQKIYSEARNAADDEWKEKENKLLLEIKKLRDENQNVVEENRSLKLKMGAGPSIVKEENSYRHSPKKRAKERVDELEQELRLQSKEVDEGMILANNLLQLVQSKSRAVVDNEKQLREHEKNTNMLVADLKELKKKVKELQRQLKQKSDEVATGLELQKDLTEKIENQASKIVKDEERLTHYEEERKVLIVKVENMENDISVLHEEFTRKTKEVEDGRKLQEQLYQQIDLSNAELLKCGQKMKESEEERKLLLRKVQCLEGEVAERGKMAGVNESYENLLKCIDLKATELASEKNKRRDLTDRYKRLKSQYAYLLSKKCGEAADSPLLSERLDEQKNSWSESAIPDSLSDYEDLNPEIYAAACHAISLNNKISVHEKLDSERVSNLPQASSSHPPRIISPNPSKRPVGVISAPLAGSKRSSSHWRDTRSHQHQDGPDPHDDFLNTPLENIKGNLKKAMKSAVHDLPVPVPKATTSDSSDDETQDLMAALNPQKQQILLPNPVVTKGYKFVEPVRKKAERENLKGVECNQCKKFYDAVLPADGGKGTDGSSRNMRCEHHEGVSRHRYRYVPPLTPEGFWNIGFDSEI